MNRFVKVLWLMGIVATGIAAIPRIWMALVTFARFVVAFNEAAPELLRLPELRERVERIEHLIRSGNAGDSAKGEAGATGLSTT